MYICYYCSTLVAEQLTLLQVEKAVLLLCICNLFRAIRISSINLLRKARFDHEDLMHISCDFCIMKCRVTVRVLHKTLFKYALLLYISSTLYRKDLASPGVWVEGRCPNKQSYATRTWICAINVKFN